MRFFFLVAAAVEPVRVFFFGDAVFGCVGLAVAVELGVAAVQVVVESAGSIRCWCRDNVALSSRGVMALCFSDGLWSDAASLVLLSALVDALVLGSNGRVEVGVGSDVGVVGGEEGASLLCFEGALVADLAASLFAECVACAGWCWEDGGVGSACAAGCWHSGAAGSFVGLDAADGLAVAGLVARGGRDVVVGVAVALSGILAVFSAVGFFAAGLRLWCWLCCNKLCSEGCEGEDAEDQREDHEDGFGF